VIILDHQVFLKKSLQHAHNFGGVTININVPSGNAEEIAEAVKRILQDTTMIEQAASK
jgi:undecaprenyl pyrophosphate synthase